jgi:hypothetical protein
MAATLVCVRLQVWLMTSGRDFLWRSGMVESVDRQSSGYSVPSQCAAAAVSAEG